MAQRCNKLDSPAARELLRCWQAWSATVTRFVRSPRHAGVSDLVYFDQHTALIDVIHARIAEVEPIEQERLRRLETYVSTWVDLDSCRLARREIQDLLRRCRQYECMLGGRRTLGWNRSWNLPSVATTSSCAVFVILAAFRPAEAYTFVSHVRHAVYHFGIVLEHTSQSDRLMTGTLVMFIFGWWMLNSMRRS